MGPRHSGAEKVKRLCMMIVMTDTDHANEEDAVVFMMVLRLEKRVMVPLPGKEARELMITQHLLSRSALDTNFAAVSQLTRNETCRCSAQFLCMCMWMFRWLRAQRATAAPI